MGGPDSIATVTPELLILRGDLLTALDAPGRATGPEAADAHAGALTVARRIGARMSELRAITRLSGSRPRTSQASPEELRTLLRPSKRVSRCQTWWPLGTRSRLGRAPTA